MNGNGNGGIGPSVFDVMGFSAGDPSFGGSGGVFETFGLRGIPTGMSIVSPDAFAFGLGRDRINISLPDFGGFDVRNIFDLIQPLAMPLPGQPNIWDRGGPAEPVFTGDRPGLDWGDFTDPQAWLDLAGDIFLGGEPARRTVPRTEADVGARTGRSSGVPGLPAHAGQGADPIARDDIFGPLATTSRPTSSSAVTVRRGMYIAGSAPGLWHTTPSRIRFDEKTGQPRETGLNRTPNRISLAQDDSGALQFFAPVEPSGWRFKYKARSARRHHHHRRRSTPHHHHRARRTRHHHHGVGKGFLSHKQLAAGFGGKAAMRTHR